MAGRGNKTRGIVPLASTTARRLLGEQHAGFLAYYLRPSLRNRWGGPFNGQRQRQQIFRDVLSAIPFSAIVETGTYRGDTTAYLRSESRLEVFTVESRASEYGFSRARFMFDGGVHVFHDDSRSFLCTLAGRADLSKRRLFLYLDAHWSCDLPLQEEIETISVHWPYAVAMVDDFAVPHDSGYGYDDYGDGQALTLDYLRRAPNSNWTAFFPRISSDAESGACRGCVLLAFREETVAALSGIPSLRIA